MGTLAWLVLILAGVALGVAVGRFWPLDSLRLKTVENERDAAAKELQSYRDEVREHFQHTGELFDRITRDYHTLYEHLATGADRLCSPAHSKNLLQAEPERRKLAHEVAQGSAVASVDDSAASVAAEAEAPPSKAGTAKDDASSMAAPAKNDASKPATGSAASAGETPVPSPGHGKPGKPAPASAAAQQGVRSPDTSGTASAPAAAPGAAAAPAAAASAASAKPASTAAPAGAKADAGRTSRDNVAAIRPDLHAVESGGSESGRPPRKNTPPAA